MTTLVKMDFSKSLWQLVMKTIHDTAWSSFPTVPEFPSSEQFAGNYADVDAYSDIFSDSSRNFNLLSSPFDSPIDMRVGRIWTRGLPAQSAQIYEVIWRNW